MAERSITGSCLCGDVQLRVRTPTLACVHCHCTICQRNHGAGYVTWVAVPRAQFEVTSGAERLVVYQSSEHGTRSFCGRCGSSLLCDIAVHPDQIDVALTCLHGPIDREPQLHIFFDDRAAWMAVGDDLPRLGGKTGLEPIKAD